MKDKQVIIDYTEYENLLGKIKNLESTVLSLRVENTNLKDEHFCNTLKDNTIKNLRQQLSICTSYYYILKRNISPKEAIMEITKRINSEIVKYNQLGVNKFRQKKDIIKRIADLNIQISRRVSNVNEGFTNNNNFE